MAGVPRLDFVRREMDRRGLDCLAVSCLENIRYLSGFTGSSALLLLTARRAVLVTDFRYRLQAGREAPEWELAEPRGSVEAFMAGLLRSMKVRRLGFEATTSLLFARRLRRAARPASTAAVEGLVEKARLVKEAGEVALMEKGVRLAAGAFSWFRGWLRAGTSEREAALELEWRLRRLGSEPPPFPVIVAAGENAALPHHRPGERRIRRGETVIVDFGAATGGYATDMTRTLCLGRPPADVAKVYRLVYDAQVSAIGAVRPGVRSSAVDAAARSRIVAAGYAELFGHGTGHGVGLDVHEAPSVSAEGKETLRAGMVITVEPGIYLPGRGGVRIEDMVLVTREGHRVLTEGLPKPADLGPGVAREGRRSR